MSTSETSSTANYDKPHAKKFVWAKRAVTLLFFILVPVLLFTLLKHIEWSEVRQALAEYQWPQLLLGLLIGLASYLTFASYELIGRRYTGHRIPVQQVIPLGFVCYAFNLNLSTWIGGIALRFRLYSRLGLNMETITKILTMSLITNWLGYIIVAGLVFSLALVDLPESWKIGATGLQILGLLLLGVALSYFFACKYAKRRAFRLFNRKITLPSHHLALAQAGLATLNWSLMGLLIFSLLPDGKVSYTTVLGILMISSIAGVITHIPAGLGVLETIFITLLQHQISKSTILAALIGYRIIYFLIPLAIALLIYLTLEAKAKKLRKSNRSGNPDD